MEKVQDAGGGARARARGGINTNTVQAAKAQLRTTGLVAKKDQGHWTVFKKARDSPSRFTSAQGV
jgi:hypothetical protein